MQEAYRLSCTKYSFCCPTRVPPIWIWLGGGTLPGSTLLGYPPIWTWLGTPPHGWGVPCQGTPIWTWPGTPCLDLARGDPARGVPCWDTPHLDLAGYPSTPGTLPGGILLGYPLSGSGWVPLPPRLDLAGYPPAWTWTWPGTPPQVWTN